jgi:hypothetical protein
VISVPHPVRQQMPNGKLTIAIRSRTVMSLWREKSAVNSSA